MPLGPLPTWVPQPGHVNTITQGAGVLANNYRDVVAPYYEPFYAVKNINDYSGARVNRYAGVYGALVGFGGGHASTNDNSVWALELGFDSLSFKRLVDPTPYFGTGTDATTKGHNAGFSGAPRVWCDQTYGEALIGGPEGTGVLQIGVPSAPHSYDALDIVGPTFGGGAQGSLYKVVQSVATYSGDNAGVNARTTFVSPHKVDFATSGGAAGEHSWARVANATFNGLTREPPYSSRFVPAQGRIYVEAGKSSHGPVWFDLATKTYSTNVSGAGKTVSPGGNSVSLVHVPERNLLLYFGSDGTPSSGSLQVQTMDVRYGATPTWSVLRTLSARIAVDGQPIHACWCPDNNRIIVGAVAGDDGCVYEIEIPTNLAATWTCTRVPFNAGQSIAWARDGTWPKGWEYNPRVKAVVYLSSVRIDDQGADVVYAYRPRGT